MKYPSMPKISFQLTISDTAGSFLVELFTPRNLLSDILSPDMAGLISTVIVSPLGETGRLALLPITLIAVLLIPVSLIIACDELVILGLKSDLFPVTSLGVWMRESIPLLFPSLLSKAKFLLKPLLLYLLVGLNNPN